MKHKCPQCNGFGLIFGLFPPTEIDCDLCKGSGLVYEKTILYRLQGMKLKLWRMNMKLTLRAAARKYNIDPANLSKMERGIIKPKKYY